MSMLPGISSPVGQGKNGGLNEQEQNMVKYVCHVHTIQFLF
jgi:hypothetical protein